MPAPFDKGAFYPHSAKILQKNSQTVFISGGALLYNTIIKGAFILKNKNSGNFFASILYILVGAVCGIFMVLSADPEKFFGGPRDFVIHMAFCMLLVFAAYFIQMVIHESGHLVFGLLSGYKFISFRVGNVMFIRESGKLRIKLYNIAGTGGQCLMMPPPWTENLPTVLYNFGGCIMNFLSAILFIAVFDMNVVGAALATRAAFPQCFPECSPLSESEMSC